MPEVSGSEFFESITTVEPDTREFPIANSRDQYIEVTLNPVDRKDLFDELNRLPDGFIEMMLSGTDAEDVEDLDEVEDADEIGIDADGADVMANIDGDAIGVFEDIFSMSAEHPELTSLDMDTIAAELEFETLFEAGGEVIDLSLSESGEIKRFRKPDSDKSS